MLRRGGRLNAVTDVEEYAAVMSALLAEQAALRPLPPPPEKEPTNDLDYLTNFERKFRKQGKQIYRFIPNAKKALIEVCRKMASGGRKPPDFPRGVGGSRPPAYAILLVALWLAGCLKLPGQDSNLDKESPESPGVLLV